METCKQTKTSPASMSSRLSEVKMSAHWLTTRTNRGIRLESLHILVLPNGLQKHEQMREPWWYQRWIISAHPSSSNGIHILLRIHLFWSSQNILRKEAQGTTWRLHHILPGRCIHYWHLLVSNNIWYCKNYIRTQDQQKETKEKTICRSHFTLKIET